MTIRTHVNAGGRKLMNHNETLTVRTALKAGAEYGKNLNHNETLQVRTALSSTGCERNVGKSR